MILPLWSWITRGTQHYKSDIILTLLTCGISNIRSAHQSYMNSSSGHNSEATLLWTSRTSTTTSICFSMWWLDSEKTFFLLISPSKYTLILNNTSSKIVSTLFFFWMIRYTLLLYTHCYWQWIVAPVKKSSMALQDYKFLNTHAHEISGWTIISRILHSRAPNIGGMNSDVQYDLSTLVFKNG